MTTDQKIAFIRSYIEAAEAESKWKEIKKYFLHMARGATMAYGAEGSISTPDVMSLIDEIETKLKEIENGTI